LRHSTRLTLLLAVPAAVVALSALPAAARLATGPTNTAAPVVSGALQAGSTLTAGPGSWSSVPITYVYTWARCDATGSACVVLSTRGNSYVVVPADAGSTLKVTVTAGNASGTGTASALTGLVTVVAPTNVSQPTINGRVALGSVLTISPGRWSGSLPQAATYQWIALTLVSGTWTPGATIGTASTLTVPGSVVGDRIEVKVTMTNGAGAATATSPQTDLVAGAMPVNTALPTFSGGLAAGSTLSVSPGTWTGPPTSVAYVWARCDATGKACVGLPPGSPSSSHTLTALDIGRTLKVTVTATNLFGASPVSVTSGIVTAVAPHDDSPPIITGSAQVGVRLTASPGSWSGALPDTYPFVWQSSPDGVTWTNLGVTAVAYTVPANLAGFQLRVVVTVANAAGSDTAHSASTGPIAGAPWSTQSPHLNTQSPKVGTTLTGTFGAWVASPTATLTYKWQRASDCVSWTDISGATTLTYVVAQADANECLRLLVTAVNSLAPSGVAAASFSTLRVIAAPILVTGPSIAIAGTSRIGAVVTATSGTWTASPACTFSYRWQFSKDGTHWEVVDGAIASRLVLTGGLLGGHVRVAVTAVNAAGNLTALTAPLAT
jgi:hypothetical protein